MRRKEREVMDFSEITDILSRCQTVRIAMKGEEYPYMVPVSFGFEVIDGKIVIYVHGASVGLKNDYLAEDNRVCVEADIFYKIEPTERGITTRYESVIGFGHYEQLTTKEDKIMALRIMTERYGFCDYPLDRCRGLEMANVFRIVVEKVSGKRNLAGN